MQRSCELEQIPVPAYLFRVLQGEFLLEQFNAEALRRNAGVSALRGKPMAALYRDQPQVAEDARRCAAEQVTVDRVLPVRRYDRIEATQNLRLTFLPAPPEHVVLFLQDVANADVARTALMESEARYQSLIASLPDGVLLRGADGRVVFCNQLALELFGAPSQTALLGESEVLSEGYQVLTESGEAVPPKEFPGRDVLDTGQPDVGTVFSLNGNARRRWLRTAAQPIRSSNGAITGSVTTITDITELVETQRALRESMSQLDLALNAGRLGIWQFELDTLTGSWSSNLDTLFRIGGRAPGLDAFLSHVHPEDRAALMARARHLSECGSGDDFEQTFRIIGTDQVTRWARLCGRLRIDPARRYVVGTVMDVTQQHTMEEELRRASRLESIGRLAGGVAHDFNNLLAAIFGSLDLIHEDVPELVSQDLDTIRHAALRARDLTRQLLAFARKQPVVWSTVEVVAMVRGIEPLLKRLVGPKVEVVSEFSEPVHVRGDSSLLEQVLLNLAANARDAMPEGGRLEIRVQRQLKHAATRLPRVMAEISVSDSGTGMDEETQKRAFDPFFTTKSSGTGLGLASSYGIIQQLGGDIAINSSLGRGTSFIVSIPAIEDVIPSEQPALPERALLHTGSGLLLVVDDDDIVLTTVSKMACSLGYQVLACANANEAVEQFMSHSDSISSVVCDIVMPERDGLSVVAAIRQVRPDIGVLFMSGYPPKEQGSPLADEIFLQKPFQRTELADKLRLIVRPSGLSARQ